RDHRFHTLIRQRALPLPTDDHRVLFETARSLWEQNWNGEPLRLLGVSMAELAQAGEERQGELFSGGQRNDRLTDALDSVRDRLGEASVVPLGSIVQRSAGSLAHRRERGHVPFGVISSRLGSVLRGGSRGL